ncbi:uncharacterized protein LOC126388858 [Epinephelus moara]|uniref:uncharacterized protein LOC126388858 n=1 Tax=Epinephelus moara TaxID=300413 RepID=UPI00214EECFD|nr:uncharacterized protein LOC126388858 [Epinephelus moara]
MILRVLANIAHKKKEFCVQLAHHGLLSALCATLKMADQEMVTLSMDVLFMLLGSGPQVAEEFVRQSGLSLLEAIQYNSEGEIRRRATHLLEHHLLSYSSYCSRVDLLAMEGTESTTRERTTTGNDGNQAAVNMELMSGKPLHRFVRNEPRSLGIVMLVFGCAELLMGFPLAKQGVRTSWTIYIPLWQGALFLVCGNLSIYTEIHPSKKMVTVSLAMYVVTLLGIFVSVGYRISTLIEYTFFYYYNGWYNDESTGNGMLTGIESILLTSSVCVLALLIFLSTIARLALKSTHSQVIFQHIPTPRSDKTSN